MKNPFELVEITFFRSNFCENSPIETKKKKGCYLISQSVKRDYGAPAQEKT
jgi:hypothetical protein